MASEIGSQMIRTSENYSMQTILSSKDSKVLIIYTGGTIGMIRSNEGYIPALNIFASALKQNPKFHDPAEHSRRLHLNSYSADNFITPESIYKKRIIFNLIEPFPVIDSCSMQMSNRLEIATIVYKHYNDYDGFLILHGTDTMAFTASALSFIFENLQKPVILTGAQIPYFEVRSDATDNLLEALTIAGHFRIPEVCLFFKNKLYRGNRTTKVDNSSFESFESPNCSYLIKCGIEYKVKWDVIRHSQDQGGFAIQKELSSDITILHFFPIITLETIKNALQEHTKALVILSYGTGNIPTNRPDFIEEFRAAIGRGVVIVNISQCKIGNTRDVYSSGKILTDIGVVLGGDMTLEATVAKLSYLLGKYPNDLGLVKKLFKKDLRGEIGTGKEKISFGHCVQSILVSIGNGLGICAQEESKPVFNKCLAILTHSLAYDGLVQDLVRLHDEGISMELRDHEGLTLLHVGCRTGNRELISFLVSVGVSVNPEDCYGRTPLYEAMMRDYFCISELLMSKGGEIRAGNKEVFEALREAVALGNLEKIRIFAKAGADLLGLDELGRSLAHYAAVKGQFEVVLYLKENGFDLNRKDVFGNTPLDLARVLGFQNIIEA